MIEINTQHVQSVLTTFNKATSLVHTDSIKRSCNNLQAIYNLTIREISKRLFARYLQTLLKRLLHSKKNWFPNKTTTTTETICMWSLFYKVKTKTLVHRTYSMHYEAIHLALLRYNIAELKCSKQTTIIIQSSPASNIIIASDTMFPWTT